MILGRWRIEVVGGGAVDDMVSVDARNRRRISLGRVPDDHAAASHWRTDRCKVS